MTNLSKKQRAVVGFLGAGMVTTLTLGLTSVYVANRDSARTQPAPAVTVTVSTTATVVDVQVVAPTATVTTTAPPPPAVTVPGPSNPDCVEAGNIARQMYEPFRQFANDGNHAPDLVSKAYRAFGAEDFQGVSDALTEMEEVKEIQNDSLLELVNLKPRLDRALEACGQN